MQRLEFELANSYGWSGHFEGLALLAAKMFSMVSDSEARINEAYLEHPNDEVFTALLTGYAKSKSAKAGTILRGFLKDDEPWVRSLSKKLLEEHYSES